MTKRVITVNDALPVQVTLPDSVLGPSGQVANTGSGFVISSGGKSAPAAFIFATLDGHIEAWNPKVDPATGDTQDEATVPGAGYTGLAIASTSAGDELFAANYATGPVNVFNSSFQQVTLAPWQFTDPRLPAGYRAFNTQVLDGRVFVTYDTLNPSPAPGAGQEGLGVGVGVVDEFSTDGRLIARIATGGPLDAPWGHVADALLAGNFGNGRISIFPARGDHFARRASGQILDASTGQPFEEPGLWGLLPRTASTCGTDAL